MDQDAPVDHYETLQVSASAEPETIHRVYRLLAQRFHPDNADTGSDTRFRLITDAYHVLSDPEQRARYDVGYQRQRQERWRLVSQAAESESDFSIERQFRLTVLEVLYTRRRLEPNEPGIFITDLEKLTGRPREHLEFTVWFLLQMKLLVKTDSSMLVITAVGVEHLEDNYQTTMQAKRLGA
jgi:curved DNA-binding protein CbpA